MKKHFAEISVAFAFWALLIIRFGYAFGTGDQAEFVPYALQIADHSLYPTDLFIQKLAENPVNERIFFCSALSIFSGNIETVCFIGHLLFTVLMIIGLLKICNLYIRNPIYSYGLIFILLIVWAGKFPGGATMYSNSFLSDAVSHAFGVWGFLYLIRNKLFISSVFLVLATLAHPLVGLFVSILSFGGYFFHISIHKKMLPPVKYFIALLIYLLTAGAYLFLLIPDDAKTLSPNAYFQIFFALRYPHHTLPSHFPAISLVGLIITCFSGLFYFYKREKTIFYFFLIQATGFCLYAIGLEYFHVVEIGLTQWFRSSMWTYFLGLIALAAMAEKVITIKWKPSLIWYLGGSAFAAISLLILFIKPEIFPLHNNPYEIGKHKYTNPEIVVSEKIGQLNLAGTYILPFNFNAFKYYARQSSYADYKTIPRKNANLGEWYRRMHLMYDLDTAHHLYGFEAEEQAKHFYRHLPDDRISQLKAEGVNYMLADTVMQNSSLRKIFNDGIYNLYELK